MACAIGLVLVVHLGLEAAVQTAVLDYQDGAQSCRGYLAYDDAQGVERRPGILIAPEWRGLDAYARSRAEQFAALGYLALALDPYGDGRVARDTQEAAALAAPYKANRLRLRSRGHAALEALRAQPLCAHGNVAAIGYCFGGTLVLEMARAGEPLRAAIIEHGDLAIGTDDHGTRLPATAGVITAKILALQGGDDPSVPQTALTAFTDEMRAAHVDWQLVEYGGAVHAFSNPKAGNDPSTGHAYDPVADRRAWDLLTRFLADLFPH